MPIDEILSNSEGSDLDAEGIEMALHYLQSQRKAELKYIMLNDKRVGIVKIASVNEKVKPISEFEIAVFDLNASIETQTEIVDNYEIQINSADEKVKMYIHEKKKTLAKTHLKKKHILQNKLGKLNLFSIELFLIVIFHCQRNPQKF